MKNKSMGRRQRRRRGRREMRKKLRKENVEVGIKHKWRIKGNKEWREEMLERER